MNQSSVKALATGQQFLWILSPFYFVVSAKLVADGVLRGTSAMGPFMIATFTDLITDDKSYGLETRGSTSFIVTSGISDWAIQFKTGCKSEYVVVDVQTPGFSACMSFTSSRNSSPLKVFPT